MSKIELFGTVGDDAKLTLHNKQRFEQWCSENKSKDIRIRLSRRYRDRSLPQNRYYFGVVIKEISIRLRELGHFDVEDEDVHEMMKQKFNYKRIVSKEGEVLDIPLKTSALTTVEFMEYLDNIRRWASDFLEIFIPDPHEKLYLKL